MGFKLKTSTMTRRGYSTARKRPVKAAKPGAAFKGKKLKSVLK